MEFINNLITVKMPGQWIDEDSDNVIDCSDIGGTNAYCDAAAKDELRRRFLPYDHRAIHILGSGNYHYLSLLWTEKIEVDYALVLIDHHPDCQESAFSEITSCGGWVREALMTQTNLKHVYMIGVDPDLLNKVLEAEKERGTIGNGQSEAATGGRDQNRYEIISCGLPDERSDLPLYLSVDTDALSPEFAACDWDQGNMTLTELTDILGRIYDNHRIIGMDICGDKKDPMDKEAKINTSTRIAICKALH